MTTTAAAALDWETIARKQLNQTRVRVLEQFAARHGEAISPSYIAGEIGEPLGNVSYHVRALLDQGLIVLDRTEPRRGALEHYYRLDGQATL